MKTCRCPRCFFFVNVANDLMEMGDVVGALNAANEVTILNDDGSVYLAAGEIEPRTGEGYTDAPYDAIEGYTDEWSPEVFN